MKDLQLTNSIWRILVLDFLLISNSFSFKNIFNLTYFLLYHRDVMPSSVEQFYSQICLLFFFLNNSGSLTIYLCL